MRGAHRHCVRPGSLLQTPSSHREGLQDQGGNSGMSPGDPALCPAREFVQKQKGEPLVSGCPKTQEVTQEFMSSHTRTSGTIFRATRGTAPLLQAGALGTGQRHPWGWTKHNPKQEQPLTGGSRPVFVLCALRSAESESQGYISPDFWSHSVLEPAPEFAPSVQLLQPGPVCCP